MSLTGVFDYGHVHGAGVGSLLQMQGDPPAGVSGLPSLFLQSPPPSKSQLVCLFPNDICFQLISSDTLLRSFHIPSFRELLYLAAIAGSGIVGLAAIAHSSLKCEVPKVFLIPSSFMLNIIDRISLLHAPYQPRPFCSHGHLETIAAALLRTSPSITYKRECITLPDGGCLALDWAFDPSVNAMPSTRPPLSTSPVTGTSGTSTTTASTTPVPAGMSSIPPPALPPPNASSLPPDAPILLLLPGRASGSADCGIKHTTKLAQSYGFRSVVLNPRGTPNTPITNPFLTSISTIDDLATVLTVVRSRYPDAAIVAVGWSLGANLLIRYLGHAGPTSPIQAAVGLSTPFDLNTCINSLTRGVNHMLYDRHLAARLRAALRSSELLWTGEPIDLTSALQATSLKQFDTAVSAISCGADNVDEYYSAFSCTSSLQGVAVPLLLMSALDDPIVPSSSIPIQAITSNPACALLTTAAGGHMGWLAGAPSFFQHTWADEVVMEFLQSAMVELANSKLKEALSASMHAATGPGVTATATVADTRATLAVFADAAVSRSMAAGSGNSGIHSPSPQQISPPPPPSPIPNSHSPTLSSTGAVIEDSPRALHGRIRLPSLRRHLTINLPYQRRSDSFTSLSHPGNLFWEDIASPSQSPRPPRFMLGSPPLPSSPSPPTSPPPSAAEILRDLSNPGTTLLSAPLPLPQLSPSQRSHVLGDALSQWDHIFDLPSADFSARLPSPLRQFLPPPMSMPLCSTTPPPPTSNPASTPPFIPAALFHPSTAEGRHQGIGTDIPHPKQLDLQEMWQGVLSAQVTSQIPTPAVLHHTSVPTIMPSQFQHSGAVHVAGSLPSALGSAGVATSTQAAGLATGQVGTSTQIALSRSRGRVPAPSSRVAAENQSLVRMGLERQEEEEDQGAVPVGAQAEEEDQGETSGSSEYSASPGVGFGIDLMRF